MNRYWNQGRTQNHDCQNDDQFAGFTGVHMCCFRPKDLHAYAVG